MLGHGPHPGGLGWALATGQLAEKIILVDDSGGEVDGWAGVSQPGSLVLHVAPGRPEIAAAVVDWLISTAPGPGLTADTFDDQSRQALAHAGFTPATAPFGFYQMGEPGLRAEARSLTAPTPAGYSIRSTRPDEAEQRVTVHRTAWRPADLPFHPDRRPDLDDSWSSSFDLDAYRRVQRTTLYDLDLDLVAVAPDGSLAGCCIGWSDPAT